MSFDVTTNFKDSNNVDLGKKLVTKDYLLTVYPSLADTGLITTTGGVWVWGANTKLQLGVNDTVTRSTPVTTILGGTDWKSVGAGYIFSVALKTDGTLWTWGNNSSGTLGVNDRISRSTPVTTLLGGTNWKSFSCGPGIVAAIKTDGTLWTWGSTSSGVLGINFSSGAAVDYRLTPVTTLLGGTNWKSVSASDYITALKTDGTLWTWGFNGNGRLGVNDTTSRSTPVTTLLGGNNWRTIINNGFDFDTSAAIKNDGTLWTWGNNSSGTLGINDTTDRITPVTTLLGGNNWKYVSSSYLTLMAIKTDGTLWVWGSNYGGSLGINNPNNILRPTPITTLLGGTNWKSVASGDVKMALKTDGTLWLWGLNHTGQLGIGVTSISRNTPVTTLLGGTNWKSFSSGSGNGLTNSHIVAIQSVDYI